MTNIEQILKAIKDNYKMSPDDICQSTGGWSALAFSFVWKDDKFFLKVYDKSVASTAHLTKSMQTYLPVLHWLETATPLNGKISKIIQGGNGSFVYEDRDFFYIMFAFIDGHTIGSSGIDRQQAEELAEIIGNLHKITPESIPFPTQSITENFSLDFADGLRKMLAQCQSKTNCPQLKTIAGKYEKSISKKLDELEILAKELCINPPVSVLCHTDAHMGNLMQANSLVLIDWEGMKLAPAEADLFMLKSNDWWPDFFAAYKKSHPNYVMNEKTMAFYTYRRIAEDIWEFMERLLYDDFSESEKNHMAGYLLIECGKI